MADHLLISRMNDRVLSDREEGDIAYYRALGLQLEYLIKILVCGVIACLNDDPNRHRYSLEYRLVRANAIGDWVDTLTMAITGPASHFFQQESRTLIQEISQRVDKTDWRYTAVTTLRNIATNLNIDVDNLGPKVSLRQLFTIAVTLRNKTTGHGAPTATQCSQACTPMKESIDLLFTNLSIFQIPWAYLHRNLSGKYRVSSLQGDCSYFEYLKKTKDVRLSNGVYLYLGKPVYVALIQTDVDVSDILVPNGQYRQSMYETLSYITNDTPRCEGSNWIDPPDKLPQSETEGHHSLDQIGNLFGNLPPLSRGYVARKELEANLLSQLRDIDRHPIISMTGPGGIGKTTLALATLDWLSKIDSPPYSVIVWVSARDIDLLQHGPKPVSPKVITKHDIAQATVELLEPAEKDCKGFSPVQYFQDCLLSGPTGATLFVIDNFETVEDPVDVYRWLDAYIRPPNKILITTRFREFAGDYPIHVDGMSEEEAQALILQEVDRLGIQKLVNPQYIEELYRESAGHPYVIKILLGRVATEKKALKPERIVAGADRILRALFERTFTSLSPAGKRTFLLLSSWRVFIPQIAVEAVSLRPRNERFDVSGALDELRRFSLVEEVKADADGQLFIGVPLAASIFGRKKLEVSPFKTAIEEDRKLLMEFGAGRREDAHRGVAPRARRLIKSVAAQVSDGRINVFEALPILEFMAAKIPDIYLDLSDLVLECIQDNTASPKAIEYLQRFLEVSKEGGRNEVWQKIAELSATSGDVLGEVHALSEAMLLPKADIEIVGNIANRINNRIFDLKGRRIEDVWSIEIIQLIEKVIKAMDSRMVELSATNCSRLAWLNLNISNKEGAKSAILKGLEKEPENEYCLKLRDRLFL